MDVTPKQIVIYEKLNGEAPYQIWFDEIADRRLKRAVIQRMARVSQGNYGDCDSVGDGISELRFHAFGVRIYFREIENVIVFLLCAGDKKTQTRDIAEAKAYWREFENRISEE